MRRTTPKLARADARRPAESLRAASGAAQERRVGHRPDPSGEAAIAHAVRVLENPISGERITFRKTAADTDGELLAFDLELDPDGHVPSAHVHPIQEERFEVVNGTMIFRRGLGTLTASAGDVVVVPPGTVHRFENAGKEQAHVRVEVRPALRMQELLETTAALAEEGRTFATGMPLPLDLALFMREFDVEVRAPFVPAAVVRAVMAPLAWLARRRRLDFRYRKPAPRAPRSRRDSRRPSTRSLRARRVATRPNSRWV
jgi:mannose-6-phosphate isomerase-like protein (cupin superfamily)